jgi:4-carboxymuconolactone decarboxylase
MTVIPLLGVVTQSILPATFTFHERHMTTRHELRQRGEAMRTTLFGADAAAATANSDAVPNFRDLMSETEFGIVWCRPGLALADRMVCTLAALASVQRQTALQRYVGAALNIGLDALAIQEVLIQIGIYAGFTASEEALDTAAGVFTQRGIAQPKTAPRDDSLETLTARGNALLQALHRDGGNKGYAAPDNRVTGALYPVAIQYGYGEIWFRPGLEQRQRVLCSVASFTALRLEGQVKKFGQAAVNLGVAKAEVIEAVIQTAPFSGFAPALNALALLSDVLKDPS